MASRLTRSIIYCFTISSQQGRSSRVRHCTKSLAMYSRHAAYNTRVKQENNADNNLHGQSGSASSQNAGSDAGDSTFKFAPTCNRLKLAEANKCRTCTRSVHSMTNRLETVEALDSVGGGK
jgi:hypothetical protein